MQIPPHRKADPPLNTRKKNHPRKASRRNQERELSRLQSELAAERRRTAKLERELSDLKRQVSATVHAQTPKHRQKHQAPEERLLNATNRRAHHHRKSFFILYLVEVIRESAPVLFIMRMLAYLRRVRLVQTIFTLLPLIMAIIAAIVAVILVSPALLPLLILIIAIPTLLAMLRFRRMNRILKETLSNCHIRVMIPPRGQAWQENSFFIRNARSMATEENTAILIVTPYLLSKRGLGGQGFFFTARQEADRLYIVRRHYFFLLRRKILDTLSANLTIIY